MEFPEANKFLGIFPVAYGSYLISVFGLGLGGCMLAFVVIIGIAENLITQYFKDVSFDDDVKKVTLLPIGLSGLLLVLSSLLLFMGVSFKRESNVRTAVCLMFTMCLLLLIMSSAIPISCFFVSSFCGLQRLSLIAMVCLYLLFTLYVEVWLYCTVIAWNYLQKMAG